MAERESPLGSAWTPGAHGNLSGGAGVRLSELKPGSIVQVAAWRGQEGPLRAAIRDVTGLDLGDAPGAGTFEGERKAFGIAPGRYLVVDATDGLSARLSPAVTTDIGTVTDLSHGRTAFRMSGPRAEWVLAKFFAIDFALAAFPVGVGRATVHHDIFAQIQRTAPDQFDLYAFRSFARSFWKALLHGAEEVGCEVA